MKSFCSLNSFKNFFLKPESREKLALKILAKIPKKWGLYRPIRKLAVRLMWQPDRLPVDRPGRPPTVRNVTVGQPRSIGTVDPNKQRALLSDPVDPYGRPSLCLLDVHICARRSTRRVDRPMVRSTVRVDRPACQHKLGSEKLGKNILINLLSFLKIL